MSNLASENSVWLKEYVKRTSSAKAKSDKKKGPVFLIVIPCVFAAIIGLMIYNGGLNDPQAFNTIKILGIIAGAILVLGIILIAAGKKKNVTTRTETNLNELLKSVDDVNAFDEQMSQEPLFVVKNDANNFFASTRDFFYERFSDMGNETYTFVKLKDIASVHYVIIKKGIEINHECIFDLRDVNGDVILNGRFDSTKKLEELTGYLGSAITVVEDPEQ